MVKAEELSNPDSCMSKANDDEMTFVLLARDECAPEVIRYWCQLRVWQGKNHRDDYQITEALGCASVMHGQRIRKAQK